MPRGEPNKLTVRQVTEAIAHYRPEETHGPTLRQCGARVGVTAQALIRHFDARGVRRRPAHVQRPPAKTVRLVVHLYIAHDMSLRAVGALFDMSESTVRRCLKGEDVSARPPGGAHRRDPTCTCDLPELLAARRRAKEDGHE